MISLPSAARIFVCVTPTDMRRQFDGLSALVSQALEKDPLSGDFFVFLNRSRTLCKILCWDRDGYLLVAKRLERGCFQAPTADGAATDVEIDAVTLAMILGGIDLASAKRRKRYAPPEANTTREAASDSAANNASPRRA
jgi:transposase